MPHRYCEPDDEDDNDDDEKKKNEKQLFQMKTQNFGNL